MPKTEFFQSGKITREKKWMKIRRSTWEKLSVYVARFVERCIACFNVLTLPQVYEEGVFMIQCDICRDWLHGECVKVELNLFSFL